MKTFCLKTFRNQHQLTYKSITEKTRIPTVHLSEIERGLRPITGYYIERITEAFEKTREKTDFINKQIMFNFILFFLFTTSYQIGKEILL